MFTRTAVNPLRSAIPAPRKPGAYFHVRVFDACVSPLGASGKTFCAFAVLHRGKPVVRRSWRTPLAACDEPCFARPVKHIPDQPSMREPPPGSVDHAKPSAGRPLGATAPRSAPPTVCPINVATGSRTRPSLTGEMPSSTHLHRQFQCGHSQSEASVTILCRFPPRRCLTDQTRSGLLHTAAWRWE